MKKKHGLAFPYRQRSVLHIDVGAETFEILSLEQQDAKALLGGRLMALALYDRYAAYDHMDEKSYESGNPVVFASGSACDISMPCCNSYTIVTKSPVTGRLSVTSVASPFAQALLGCGYAAMVITGRCRKLSCISLSDGTVEFSDAEPYHDLTTTEVARKVGSTHTIIIGPAGEHVVSHASLVVDGQNVTRGGVGMVFGLKNIKCISLYPQTNGREPYDSESMGLLKQAYMKDLEASKIGKTMVREGSIALLSKANQHGWAAIDDYSMRIDGRLWGLCSRGKEEKNPPGTQLCSACMEHGQLGIQSAMALGSNLELFDSRSVQQLVNRCLENGLDPLSAGSVLAWARKSRQDGLLGFLPDMQRSSGMLYLRMLDAMAYRRGAGEQLSKNLYQLGEQFGGSEHAYTALKLELAPFDYRALPVQALLTSLGDGSLVLGELLWGNHYRRGDERRLASWALFIQQFTYAMESVGLCSWVSLPLFARPFLHYPWYKGKRKAFSRLARLASLSEGYELTFQDIEAFGEKALRMEMEINNRLTGDQGRYGNLPDQLLVNGKSNYRFSQVVPLARLLDAYWSLVNGK